VSFKPYFKSNLKSFSNKAWRRTAGQQGRKIASGGELSSPENMCNLQSQTALPPSLVKKTPDMKLFGRLSPIQRLLTLALLSL
jgi:hypothetical protein